MVSAIRVTSGARPSMDAIWAALATIPDPEIPVISLVELGIVREVCWRDGQLVVTLTPTYSGCPATEVIAADVAAAVTKLERRISELEAENARLRESVAQATRVKTE